MNYFDDNQESGKTTDVRTFNSGGVKNAFRIIYLYIKILHPTRIHRHQIKIF